MGYLNRTLLTIALMLVLVSSKGLAISDGGLQIPRQASETPLVPVWLTSSFSTSETEHFLVAHDTGSNEAVDLAYRLEYAYKHFHQFFEKFGFELQTLTERLSWISFTEPSDFSQYAQWADRMDLSRLSGYYSAKTNRVAIVGSALPKNAAAVGLVLRRPADTDGNIAAMAGDDDPNQFVKIAHELAHQLAFNTGLQKRGVMYPLWVSEGLATQYETKLSYCRDTNTARNARLAEMQAYGRVIPLEAFIGVTRLPAEQYLCEDLYAQAWGFFNFLLENRPDQLRSYLTMLHAGRTGYRPPVTVYKEFTDHFGPLQQLQTEWLRSL